MNWVTVGTVLICWGFATLGFIGGIVYKTWIERRAAELREANELRAAMKASVLMFVRGRGYDMPPEDWARLSVTRRIEVKTK